MVTSLRTSSGLSGLCNAIRYHLGWVSSLASCRDAVGCLGNFLSGWCNYGALGLIFNNKANIISNWAEEGKMPILPNSGGGRGLSCLSENRLSSAALLSH